MPSRIEEELELLRTRFPNLEFEPRGNWVRITSYSLPTGWNRNATDVAFQFVSPPAAPYGIYVPSGLLFSDQRPTNYSEPAGNVPFAGTWGIFSWSPGDGEWRPSTTVVNGTNYLNWVLGFASRFKEGI